MSDEIIRALHRDEVNDLQQASIDRLLKLIRHGAKFVDIEVRKDGKEYRFEADWLVLLAADRRN